MEENKIINIDEDFRLDRENLKNNDKSIILKTIQDIKDKNQIDKLLFYLQNSNGDQTIQSSCCNSIRNIFKTFKNLPELDRHISGVLKEAVEFCKYGNDPNLIKHSIKLVNTIGVSNLNSTLENIYYNESSYIINKYITLYQENEKQKLETEININDVNCIIKNILIYWGRSFVYQDTTIINKQVISSLIPFLKEILKLNINNVINLRVMNIVNVYIYSLGQGSPVLFQELSKYFIEYVIDTFYYVWDSPKQQTKHGYLFFSFVFIENYLHSNNTNGEINLLYPYRYGLVKRMSMFLKDGLYISSQIIYSCCQLLIEIFKIPLHQIKSYETIPYSFVTQLFTPPVVKLYMSYFFHYNYYEESKYLIFLVDFIRNFRDKTISSRNVEIVAVNLRLFFGLLETWDFLQKNSKNNICDTVMDIIQNEKFVLQITQIKDIPEFSNSQEIKNCINTIIHFITNYSLNFKNK